MITFEQVSKAYLGKYAIKDITTTLPKGKIIGVVGPNGTGKSTTLKLIAGLIRPTKGRVTVDGMEVDRKISKHVTYLSELDEYYTMYSVMETVQFFATQFEDFNLSKAEEMIQFMKLDPNTKVKHLSKGNRGRLKIILSLARDASYILMDEPLSGLDPMVRDTIVKGLVSFIDLEKQTVLISTHEVSEIEPMLDYVVAIKDNQFVEVADVDQLRQEEQLSIVEWMKKIYAS
ncbi:ABC transporter ATP-binding protein [Bacillus horti]|uniref:ABC-2 type transport system ATP-binding protein n=1 Tax=Caldalkalibacillus horti TaxID=77523 RepID=A0ABT9W4K8_9BACI|nr:ABC transporter ATP-binding protein [Bacillus horti]MDQ0168186.1 ABC-2 type transport system ATP-binding protein [Bacillus horti]